jgi:hypothetical protein
MIKFDKTKLLNKNNTINFERFVDNEKYYLKQNIINTITTLNPHIKKYKLTKQSKTILFNEIKQFIYKYDNLKIVKIQSLVRKFLVLKNKIKGPGYFNKLLIKNSEEFYYLCDVKDINSIYFFSYKDKSNNIWAFDIRSIYNLLKKDNKNPWTREIIPDNIISNVYSRIKYLFNKHIDINLEKQDFKNNEQKVYRLLVDYVSEITRLGYNCEVHWISNLSLIGLVKFYRALEDIWNYRAQITPENKKQIIPPTGILFNHPLNTLHKIKKKYILVELILNELKKFSINNNTQLGCIYFLIGLSEVNIHCKNANILLQL